jgi:hypothetical protein
VIPKNVPRTLATTTQGAESSLGAFGSSRGSDLNRSSQRSIAAFSTMPAALGTRQIAGRIRILRCAFEDGRLLDSNFKEKECILPEKEGEFVPAEDARSNVMRPTWFPPSGAKQR